VDLPARGGAAARLAHLMHERGLSASIRPAGRALVLTVRNPAVPNGTLTQKVAHVPDDDGGKFLWLFEGQQRGTWDTDLLGPASDVEAAADRLARVLSIAETDQ
jgi:hypothetical protein